MLEAYSLNAEVSANASVPFNNVKVQKGCTAVLSGVSSIELNKCGVYMVDFDGVAGTSTTVQLYRDGVALPETQREGTTLHFQTLVQVDHNNNGCCCSSPVTLRVENTTATTFDVCDIVVTKVC